MEAVIFVGVQGSGKTTLYLERFFTTHVRLSLDMLRTRNRERLLLDACIEAKQPFVIDNTNPTVEERARYIFRPGKGKLGVVQIAGLVARRIVPFVREGASVGAGERIGMIRFGSRVDVYLPEGTSPLVSEGQTSLAGETVIADLSVQNPGRTYKVG